MKVVGPIFLTARHSVTAADTFAHLNSSSEISLLVELLKGFSLSSPSEQFEFLKRQLRLVALLAPPPEEIVDGLIHTSALSALRWGWRPGLVNLHLCEGTHMLNCSTNGNKPAPEYVLAAPSRLLREHCRCSDRPSPTR